jgi:ABC-2 type transport system permease protein
MNLVRGELTKILLQKRTYVGWAGLLIVPIIMVVALYLSSAKPGQGEGPAFFSQAVGNGMYVPLAAMAALSVFLLPLISAMAGAHPLAGEAEQGTIKTWLVHPVSRGGVLLSKWGVAILYVAIGFVLVGGSAFAAGALAFGVHPIMLLSGGTASVGQGLWLTLLSYLYIFVEVVCVLSLALLLSTLTDSSLTAAIGAVVVVIVLQILGSFSYFDFLKPYLFTGHLDAWQSFFSKPIDWSAIRDGLITFAVYIAGFTSAAWLIFRRKDILV